MRVKAFSLGDFSKKTKQNLNYCSQTGAVVQDGAMIKHNLDQTSTLFHVSLTFTIKGRLAPDINEPTNPFGPLVITVNCL